MSPETHAAAAVFAPIDGDAAMLRALIESEGIPIRACADAQDFYSALRGAPLYVVITEEGLARCTLEDLDAAVRDQPPWSNVPILVLAEAEPGSKQVDSNRFIRLANLGNVTLLTRPTSRQALLMALRSALRTRHLQFAVRDQLRELEGQAEQLEFVVAERTRQLVVEVTERRRVEQTLAEAKRLESLGRLTGGVAHDFNNLLQVVTGSEALLRVRLGSSADPGVGRALESIRRAASHGASLTQQLLAYARRQPLESVVLDLRTHLQATADMVLRILGPDIRLRLQLAPFLWPVFVDPAQFDAAILNIAANARDAMAPDGSLVMSARNWSLPDEALPEGEHLAGDFVGLCLTDDGHGMSEETFGQAFEPFFTTKEVGKGTGLGLSQVYGFAIQSQGLAFIRREAAGTTVGLLLPRAQDLPVAGHMRPAQGAQGVDGLRILYVEDDPDVAETTTAILEALGAAVRVVETADAAVHADLSGIDAVLSDVMMPGSMDGIDLAHWLAQHHPAVPVVLTSGYMLAPERLQALHVQFVRKPFVASALVEAFVKALKNKEAGR